MSRRSKQIVVGLVGAGAALAAWVSPAGAHVVTLDSEAPSGSYFTTAFMVPHGCDGSPTTKVDIRIAEGVTSVKPQPVAGWSLSSTTRQLDPPLETEGGQLTETTDTVTWAADAGNALPDGELQMFWVTMKLPEGDAGTSVAFPIVQTCEQGETRWIEPVVEGQEEPEHPAPAITLTAAEGDGHGGAAEEAATEAESTDESHDGEEAAASDDESSDDDSSSNGLAIAGLAVGAVGVVTGGIALARTSGKNKDAASS